MFFIRAGYLVAILATVTGLAGIAQGVWVAGMDPDDYAIAVSRYLGGRSSGARIDYGIKLIAYGIPLGILAEIGRSLHKRAV